MKKPKKSRRAVYIIGAIIALGVIIWLATTDWDKRRIYKNLNRLAAVVVKPKNTTITGVLLFQNVAVLRSLFTEDCVITPGEPVPQIHGRDELCAIFSQAINMVSEFKVVFKDVSVNVAPGHQSATATMTAEGIGTDIQGGPKQYDAREIEMGWNKIEGKWKIETVKEVKTLH